MPMKNGQQRMWFFTSQVMALVTLFLFLGGCAQKGPILLTVAYQPGAPAEKTVAGQKISVAVSPLRDERVKPASVLGARRIPDGQEDDLVVSGTVAEIATMVLKQALAARNIAVTDAPAWDLTAEGMSAEGSPLLLGGQIKTLWLESTASSLKTHVNAFVQFKIVAGDVATKKIVRTIEVSSKLDQDVLYSRAKLQTIISEALSTAIDQIFQDDEMKKRLQ